MSDLERLAAYDRMYADLLKERDKVLADMEKLRSAGKNINPIAVKYGGGGHAKASGATVADRDTAMAMLADLNAIATGGN